MKTSFLAFAASRYLRGVSGRREGSRFLRFITVVAIGGIAVGVAALLLALAIVRGFSNEIQTKIIGFGAHIQVENIQDAPIENADEIVETIRNDFEGVANVRPYVEEFGLLRYGSKSIEGIRLSGTDKLPDYVASKMVSGDSTLASREGNNLVIGKTLAETLGAQPGDSVIVFSLNNGAGESARSGFQIPRLKQFRIVGIYETSLADYDEVVAFTHLEPARSLFRYGTNDMTRIDVTMTDPATIAQTARRIEDRFGFPLMARTIYEVFQSIFAWVRLQESIIPVVISVIVVVAAFNIVGTMLMILLEKTSEVGILMSLGAAPSTVRRLFVFVGLGLGAVGTLIGSILALAFAIIQKKFGVIPLPAESYYMDTAPVQLAASDFIIVALVSLVLCVIAAYIPARVASRIRPVSVIRFR